MARVSVRFFAATVAPIALGVLLGLAATTTERTDAIEQPVEIRVRPQILLARGDVRVELRVPRDTDNRLLALAWGSDTGTAGSSQWQMDGEDAPVLYVRALPDTPAAHYTFVATVFGRAGEIRGRATAEIVTPDGSK